MHSHVIVGMTDGASLAVNIVPWTTDFGMQPTLQRAEQALLTFPLGVDAFNAFKLWQKRVR